MHPGNNDQTRRKFLSKSLTCVASAGLIGISPQVVTAKKPEKKKIIYRKLGKTKIELPIVSMGVMNASTPGIVQASYELGVRHFDTAANYQYGRNEQMVGNVIKRLGVRDKVTIGTKELRPVQRQDSNPDQLKDKLIKTCDGSLRRLKTDYIDILYIHNVINVEDAGNQGMMEGMEHLKKQGKIRFTGIATHGAMASVIEKITSDGFYDVVLTSINVSMADDIVLQDAIKNAASKGIGIIAMKTLAGGPRLPNQETLRQYSSSTITKASLKWVLRNKNITTSIPGYTNYEHLNEDFSVVYDLEYTPEEKKFLSENSIKMSMGFCRQCRFCTATCPNGVDVPSLMRTHMYAAQYADFHEARAVLDDIPRGSGIEACVTCKDCTAQCVNYVDIPRKINELKVIYA